MLLRGAEPQEGSWHQSDRSLCHAWCPGRGKEAAEGTRAPEDRTMTWMQSQLFGSGWLWKGPAGCVVSAPGPGCCWTSLLPPPPFWLLLLSPRSQVPRAGPETSPLPAPVCASSQALASLSP
uniref:Uncharacterized protein n=1 Tax=Pipistrellus kuhlii TaxID=59472 RepID=A0A7J7SGM3_PIPKU|nr:hypothetical protein mPipKuh1_009969 [Pipistrellus kuhlii]